MRRSLKCSLSQTVFKQVIFPSNIVSEVLNDKHLVCVSMGRWDGVWGSAVILAGGGALLVEKVCDLAPYALDPPQPLQAIGGKGLLLMALPVQHQGG